MRFQQNCPYLDSGVKRYVEDVGPEETNGKRV